MRCFVSRSKFIVTCVCLLALTLAGCGDARRQSVRGTVTVDGQPLKEGAIRFIPTEDASGPTAGANIVDGQFEIPKETGTFAGKFKVQITARRPSSKLMRDPETGQATRGFEQYIPAKYNTRTELTADVKAGEDNEFTFDLKSR